MLLGTEEKSFLTRLPLLSAATTSATLLLSVIHDWSYYFVVGTKWITLQTVGDYISSALEWLPITIGVLAVGIVPTVYSSSFGRRANSDLSRRAIKWITGIFWVVVTTVTLFLLYSFLMGSPLTFAPLVMAAWMLPVAIVTQRFDDVPRESINHQKIWSAIYIPFVLLSVAANGFDKGNRALKNPYFDHAMFLKDGTAPHPVSVLKFLERGVLIRVGDKNTFLRWDSLASITAIQPPPDERPRVCQWFDWFCPISTSGSAAP